MRSIVHVVLAVVAIGSSALAGDLNPPPGPVAPTMKPLDDVEPRIALSSQNTPGLGISIFTITQPGSYYLTGNVLGASGIDGIRIMANEVTLDLNGFSVQGVPGAGQGINVGPFGFQASVRITNGVVTDWPQAGIRFQADGSQVDRVRFANNGTFALDARSSFALVLSECVSLQDGDAAVENGSDGAFALANDSTVRDCHVRDCLGIGFLASSSTGSHVFERCAVRTSAGVGFFISGASVSIENCSATASERQGFVVTGRSATLSGCAASNSDEEGFLIRTRTASLENCTVHVAGSAGIRYSIEFPNDPLLGSAVMQGCSVSDAIGACYLIQNPARLENCAAAEGGTIHYQLDALTTLDGCSSTGTPSIGAISTNSASTIRNCTVRLTNASTQHGIIVTGDNAVIRGNTIIRTTTGVGGDGVRIDGGNRALIDGNSITSFNNGVSLLNGSLLSSVYRNQLSRVNISVLNNGSSSVIAPFLNGATISTATNPFANVVN